MTPRPGVVAGPAPAGPAGTGQPLRDYRIHRYVNAFCPTCHEEDPERPLAPGPGLAGDPLHHLALVRQGERLARLSLARIAFDLGRREEALPFFEHLAASAGDPVVRGEALVLGAVDVARQEDLLRLACELAWIERIVRTGEDTSRIAQAFDTTIARLPLTADVSARAQAARARLLQTDVSLGATASAND